MAFAVVAVGHMVNACEQKQEMGKRKKTENETLPAEENVEKIEAKSFLALSSFFFFRF